MRSPMTPQRGQNGPSGYNTVSRYSRAALSSWKIALRRFILLRAIGIAFQLSGDPIKWPVLRQPDNALSVTHVRIHSRERDFIVRKREQAAWGGSVWLRPQGHPRVLLLATTDYFNCCWKP